MDFDERAPPKCDPKGEVPLYFYNISKGRTRYQSIEFLAEVKPAHAPLSQDPYKRGRINDDARLEMGKKSKSKLQKRKVLAKSKKNSIRRTKKLRESTDKSAQRRNSLSQAYCYASMEYREGKDSDYIFGGTRILGFYLELQVIGWLISLRTFFKTVLSSSNGLEGLTIFYSTGG